LSRLDQTFLNWDVLFTSEIAYTSEEHRKISEVADVVEGKQAYYKNSILRNPTSVLVVDESCANVGALERIDQPTTIQLAVSNGEEITIFGKQLTMPFKVVTLEGVLPKIHNELGSLREGDVVSVEWVPQDNFKCTIGYET
jgi:PleD family two-component response regulator